MAQKSGPAAVDPTWAAFKAEAMPHLDRLFRLAMCLHHRFLHQVFGFRPIPLEPPWRSASRIVAAAGPQRRVRSRVPLLVTAVDGSVTPALPGETRPHLTSPSRIDGMSVVSFRATRQVVFFAGDVVQDDLLKLAEAVGEPLYRGLSTTESAGARRRFWAAAIEDSYALDLGIGSSPVTVHTFRVR